jgi:hypothetical protein
MGIFDSVFERFTILGSNYSFIRNGSKYNPLLQRLKKIAAPESGQTKPYQLILKHVMSESTTRQNFRLEILFQKRMNPCHIF